MENELFQRGVKFLKEQYPMDTNTFKVLNSGEVALMSEMFNLGRDFITIQVLGEENDES